MKQMKITFSLIIFASQIAFLFGQDTVDIRKVIYSIKHLNTKIQTVGILTAEYPEEKMEELLELQPVEPRDIRIRLTQSGRLKDIYLDFTYLSKKQKVDAVIIYPGKFSANKRFRSKIKKASARWDIPIIAMEEGWEKYDAMWVFYEGEDGLKIHANEIQMARYGHTATDDPNYAIIYK